MTTVMMATPKEERRYQALGDRLTQARYAAGFSSQRAAAKAIGELVSEGYLPAIENGTRCPRPKVLRRIAQVYGVRFEELAELAGYVTPQEGDVLIRATREEADDLEPFRGLSAEARKVGLAAARAADRLVRTLSPTERIPGGAHARADGEAPQERDQQPE